MNIFDSVRSALSQYTGFKGRACRSEFWWWQLFSFMVLVSAAQFDTMFLNVVNLFASTPQSSEGPFQMIWLIGTAVPSLSLCVRRLHDIDRRGWWVFIVLVPVFGFLYLLYQCTKQGSRSFNRFGDNPLGNRRPASHAREFMPQFG
ncbi:Uncharacterized membrane protein YhaH, DUF805 family [Cohaesibacter sp. ES.047]|uniref:DUF805 domain-containing protein n=1 Tax=Cohaesibacter sp. ES.047 TaxID=1798205 RepID=UPI000BBFDF29|nr:DUF805 domain-containing protein [Cohaesibacter sp. ES.047]SNY92561.1 Uncharacterized membrane protein YhaH, DUF805 family [Cohaesibacter sp. ES.047]